MRIALFPEVCGATTTETHPAAARPDGKGGGEKVMIHSPFTAKQCVCVCVQKTGTACLPPTLLYLPAI